MPYRSVLRPGLFAGQTIVVTGGGSGIGRCTAHELASLGAHVAIAGRKPDKLAAVKAEIEQSGGSCETHAFDIREEMQVKDAIAAIVAKNGRIHGLFNNAGGQFPAPAAAMSAKGFDVVVRNNLTGGFIVSREVFTQSMEKHGGAIVNMTRSMASHHGVDGIRVNCVAPGYVYTPMVSAGGMSDELRDIRLLGVLYSDARRVAIVQAGGTQHRVEVGQYLGRQHGRVERLDAPVFRRERLGGLLSYDQHEPA